jgi:hypothetical protein
VVGSPAVPVREFFRQVATLRRLAERPTARQGAATQGGAGTEQG